MNRRESGISVICSIASPAGMWKTKFWQLSLPAQEFQLLPLLLPSQFFWGQVMKCKAKGYLAGRSSSGWPGSAMPSIINAQILEKSRQQDVHWEVRHAGSVRHNPIPPPGSSPVFSTKLCGVNKRVRELCPYHLKNKAYRRHMIKNK